MLPTRQLMAGFFWEIECSMRRWVQKKERKLIFLSPPTLRSTVFSLSCIFKNCDTKECIQSKQGLALEVGNNDSVSSTSITFQ